MTRPRDSTLPESPRPPATGSRPSNSQPKGSHGLSPGDRRTEAHASRVLVVLGGLFLLAAVVVSLAFDGGWTSFGSRLVMLGVLATLLGFGLPRLPRFPTRA